VPCERPSLVERVTLVCNAEPVGIKEFIVEVLKQNAAVGVALVTAVLNWPVMLLVAVLLLLDPLKKLLGRVKNAKGLGMDVEFHQEMKEMESSADQAIDEAVLSRGDDPSGVTTPLESSTETLEEMRDRPAEVGDHARVTTPSPWKTATMSPEAREAILRAARTLHASSSFLAAKDPSGAIIKAWQRLFDVLVELNVATRGRGRPTRRPALVVRQLAAVAPPSFIETVESLRKLRDDVAHGEVAPSPGVARTYTQRAGEMTRLAMAMLEQNSKNSAFETSSAPDEPAPNEN